MQMLAGAFEAGIYDTAHMARSPQFDEIFQGRSALEHVYETMVQVGKLAPVEHAEGFSLYSNADGKSLQTPSRPLGVLGILGVHNVGNERFRRLCPACTVQHTL
eukprot:8006210-Pyramimonas_sp.AAC.1